MQADLFAQAKIARFVSLSCGTAAVALAAALGKPRADRVFTTYLGGKSRDAARILSLAGLAEGQGVRTLVLNDLGQFGEVWGVLASPRWAEVVEVIASMEPGEEQWRALASAPVPVCPVRRSAVWVALQAGSVMGKPVVVRDGRWKTHGYARLSPAAVKLGFTARLNPPTLASKVSVVARGLARCEVVASQRDARAVPVVVDGLTVVYLDPPYREGTGYEYNLSRSDVVELGTAWHVAGAKVLISESEPVVIGRGETHHKVSVQTDQRERPDRQEWLTVLEAPDA